MARMMKKESMVESEMSSMLKALRMPGFSRITTLQWKCSVAVHVVNTARHGGLCSLV